MSYATAVIVLLAAILGFYVLENGKKISVLKVELNHLNERINDVLRQPPSSLEEVQDTRPVAVITGKNVKENDPAHLFHVHEVFTRLGYRTILGLEHFKKHDFDFDILWNHEFPFMNPETKSLVEHPKPHQKINHVPGSGYYTSKVALATANLSIGVPLAFALPKQRREFEDYSKKNPGVRWVQKSNAHRNIKVLPTDQLELDKADTFIQKFVENPLLIDGKKFDIGIYTVITSISPLKVYIFDGDALIRFCAKNYEPFDSEDVDKYVVGDDYTPVWEMPSLKRFFVDADLTFKETLNKYLLAQGKDPETIWEQIREIITHVFEKQNGLMIAAAAKYKVTRGYFELSRFDFVVDSNLKVYLMEANMSPNLSSGHFKQNRLLYEQVVFNVLSLIGGTRTLHSPSTPESKEMQVSDKDLNLYFPECETEKCASCPETAIMVCGLCRPCQPPDFREVLRQTFLEHLNRRQMRRILPRKFSSHGEATLTRYDLLLSKWLEIKCEQNRHFCE